MVYLETIDEVLSYLNDVINELQEDDELQEYEHKRIELQIHKDILSHFERIYKMQEIIDTLENDNNAIPDFLWDKIKSLKTAN